MSVINTNLSSLTGQAQRNQADAKMSTAMQRLSSGLRINSAADDAAGKAIANRMEANIRATDQTSQGINDGISLMQTAEGGLDGINDILQRARELAVQASSDTLSDSDRAAVNAEYHQLREEIDRVALGTEAFGKTPLAPTAKPPESLGDTPCIVDLPIKLDELEDSGIRAFRYIPEGVTGFRLSIYDNGANDDIQLFTQDGTHVAGSEIPASPSSNSTWGGISTANVGTDVFKTSAGFEASASYDASQLNTGTSDPSTNATSSFRGMNITYSGDANATGSLEESIQIDEVTEPLFIYVTGSGQFTFTELGWETPVPPPPTPESQPTEIVMSANYGQTPDTVTIEPTPADHASLGLEDVELDPIEKAREAMAKLQESMNQVDGYRSQYGALQNRFEGAIEGLANQSVATQAAQSRIMDADYAEEASRLVKAQILQQAGDAMLTQANQSPRQVLSLLGANSG
ncbi:flagellin [Vreelandella aquamarina]